ncbi:MAG TPA: F0F1 ATP synthase subunit A [Candidatus Sulfotelmatobacter sp.]|jgi:F-type H+-transporting ATPase subunit a|nr:F0F1 ATP synthase subunit A [Candidatus Sulfotelmatobacter sp.]
MPEQLWFTQFLNHLLGGPVTAFLRALHIEPKYPTAPIPNSFAMELIVFFFLLALFFMLRSRLSVDSPGGLQHSFEKLDEFILGQSHDIIGHHSGHYTPFFAILFVFILICNLIGLIPGFESPTGVSVVPLGCAIVAFFYYHAQGFKHAGIGYLKHFLGPIPALAPLMLPIEVISHFARLLSLTVRLWANIFAGDLITLVFFSMIPIGVPIIFIGLHIVVAILQAYVFMLLAIIYVSGAVSEEH